MKLAMLAIAKGERSMIRNIIYFIGGFIVSLIALRVLLLLLGANPSNEIVNWIYTWSTPFVAPFSGIFGQDATIVSGAGTVTSSVFDWTALIALVVIGLIFGLVGGLFNTRRVAV